MMRRVWLFPKLAEKASKSRIHLFLAGLAVGLAVMVIFSIGKGAVYLSPMQCLSVFAHHLGYNALIPTTAQQEAVLLSIRLPRILLGLLVGAGLAISGVAMQGLFRNALADPSLIGVSGGAALGATGIIVISDLAGVSLGTFPGFLALPVAAFVGGLGTTYLILRIAGHTGTTQVSTLLLVGIAINALVQALIGLLTFFATDTALRNLTFWRLGSLGGATWTTVGVMTPFVVIPLVVFPQMGQSLNIYLLGESEAFHLGLNLERLKQTVIVLVAVAVGATVSVTGIIGFVGLIVPHLLRQAIGPDHRFLFPASALLGALLLVLADMIARTIVVPAELPIGIITALIGAPVFLWMLVNDRNLVGTHA